MSCVCEREKELDSLFINNKCIYQLLHFIQEVINPKMYGKLFLVASCCQITK